MKFPDGSVIDLVREYHSPQVNAFGFSEATRVHVFHYFDSNRVEQPHVINGQEMLVTWNLGYFLALNFNKFPNDTTKYIQAGATRSFPPNWSFVDTLNIKTKQIFDFNLGDEFHYEITERNGNSNSNLERTIFLRKMLIGQTKSVTEDTLLLTWFRVQTIFESASSGIIDTSFTIDTVSETLRLQDYPWLETPPNGFIENGKFGSGYIDMFKEDKYGRRTQKNVMDFFTYSLASNCLTPKTSVVEDSRHHYAAGLGETSYFEEFADPEFNFVQREMIFFQKGLHEWGTPIVFSLLLPIEEVEHIPLTVNTYPNPTVGNSHLLIETENPSQTYWWNCSTPVQGPYKKKK